MKTNLTKKYVIGTHIMWFEIEMYSDLKLTRYNRRL